MSIFIAGLGILSVMCALIYRRSSHPGCRDAQFNKFKRTYLFVYLLATGRTGQKYTFVMCYHYAVWLGCAEVTCRTSDREVAVLTPTWCSAR